MSVRVYLPVTVAELRTLLSTGELPGPRTGHAVTDELWAALGEEWPDAGQEEAEYAALAAAAEQSRDAAGDQDPGVRRVLAADVETVTPLAEEDPTRVTVTDAVPYARVAALHADPAPGADPDDELAWYATQEIAALVGGPAL